MQNRMSLLVRGCESENKSAIKHRCEHRSGANCTLHARTAYTHTIDVVSSDERSPSATPVSSEAAGQRTGLRLFNENKPESKKKTASDTGTKAVVKKSKKSRAGKPIDEIGGFSLCVLSPPTRTVFSFSRAALLAAPPSVFRTIGACGALRLAVYRRPGGLTFAKVKLPFCRICAVCGAAHMHTEGSHKPCAVRVAHVRTRRLARIADGCCIV